MQRVFAKNDGWRQATATACQSRRISPRSALFESSPRTSTPRALVWVAECLPPGQRRPTCLGDCRGRAEGVLEPELPRGNPDDCVREPRARTVDADGQRGGGGCNARTHPAGSNAVICMRLLLPSGVSWLRLGTSSCGCTMHKCKSAAQIANEVLIRGR